MGKDKSWYVLKSTSGMYYLERSDSISWVKDINKASRYSRLLANTTKAKLNIIVTLEKVENNV